MNEQVTEFGKTAKTELAMSRWIKKAAAIILSVAGFLLAFKFLDEAPPIRIPYGMGGVDVMMRVTAEMQDRHFVYYEVCMFVGFASLLYAVGYFEAVRKYRKAKKQQLTEGME